MALHCVLIFRSHIPCSSKTIAGCFSSMCRFKFAVDVVDVRSLRTFFFKPGGQSLQIKALFLPSGSVLTISKNSFKCPYSESERSRRVLLFSYMLCFGAVLLVRQDNSLAGNSHCVATSGGFRGAVKACSRCVLYGGFPRKSGTVLNENRTLMNGVHRRQNERVHNKVRPTKI